MSWLKSFGVDSKGAKNCRVLMIMLYDNVEVIDKSLLSHGFV